MKRDREKNFLSEKEKKKRKWKERKCSLKWVRTCFLHHFSSDLNFLTSQFLTSLLTSKWALDVFGFYFLSRFLSKRKHADFGWLDSLHLFCNSCHFSLSAPLLHLLSLSPTPYLCIFFISQLQQNFATFKDFLFNLVLTQNCCGKKWQQKMMQNVKGRGMSRETIKRKMWIRNECFFDLSSLIFSLISLSLPLSHPLSQSLSPNENGLWQMKTFVTKTFIGGNQRQDLLSTNIDSWS